MTSKITFAKKNHLCKKKVYLFKKSILNICVCVCVCICGVHCVHLQSLAGESDPLELEAQATAIHLTWVWGTELQTSSRAALALNH